MGLGFTKIGIGQSKHGTAVPERRSRMVDWICETCIHYPPSSLDGKPCCMCDPDDPMLNCYCEKEEQA